MYAQREAKQKQDRRLGASVITDQIKERPNPNPNPNPNPPTRTPTLSRSARESACASWRCRIRSATRWFDRSA